MAVAGVVKEQKAFLSHYRQIAKTKASGYLRPDSSSYRTFWRRGTVRHVDFDLGGDGSYSQLG